MRNIKKKKQMLKKFMRSPSFSILKSKTNYKKGKKKKTKCLKKKKRGNI